MRLLLLGTGGYHPSGSRQTACLAIPEYGVVLDAGTGLFRLGRHLTTPTIDIFLTHAHLDHVVGLTYLFSTLREHPLDRITIHAEPEKCEAIEEHLFADVLFPARPPMQFKPIASETPLAGGGRLETFPLCHAGGSLGFRLEWPGHSMAYVTDTTAALDAPYVERIKGVDLLVHECYYPDRLADLAEKYGHSATSAVAEVARAANVKRVVLTHVDPLADDEDFLGLDAGRAIFAPLELGRDGQIVEF